MEYPDINFTLKILPERPWTLWKLRCVYVYSYSIFVMALLIIFLGQW